MGGGGSEGVHEGVWAPAYGWTLNVLLVRKLAWRSLLPSSSNLGPPQMSPLGSRLRCPAGGARLISLPTDNQKGFLNSYKGSSLQ